MTQYFLDHRHTLVHMHTDRIKTMFLFLYMHKKHTNEKSGEQQGVLLCPPTKEEETENTYKIAPVDKTTATIPKTV